MKKRIEKVISFLKYYFGFNKKKREPLLVRLKGWILLFLLIISLELVIFANFLGVIDYQKLLATILPEKLVEFTNLDREKRERGELVVSDLLNEAAKMKAEDMAQKEYFAHVSPEGVTPWYWFSEVGYDYRYAGENLAVNFIESYSAHRAWMDSPTHKANIISDNFEEIGIATAVGRYKGEEATYVVQLFGTRDRGREPLVQEKAEEDKKLFIKRERDEVLGKEIKEDVVLSKDEEKEESFIFFKEEGGISSYLVSNIDDIFKEREYASLLTTLRTDFEKIKGYLLFILSIAIFSMVLLKILFLRKTRFSFLFLNKILILIILLSAITVTHYAIALVLKI